MEKQLGLHLQMNPFGEVERFKLKITNSLVLDSKWRHAEQEKRTRFHSAIKWAPTVCVSVALAAGCSISHCTVACSYQSMVSLAASSLHK